MIASVGANVVALSLRTELTFAFIRFSQPHLQLATLVTMNIARSYSPDRSEAEDSVMGRESVKANTELEAKLRM